MPSHQGKREGRTSHSQQEGTEESHNAVMEAKVGEDVITVSSQAPRPGVDDNIAYVPIEERRKQYDKAVAPNSDKFRQMVQSFQRILDRDESIDSILRRTFSAVEAASLFPDAVSEAKLSDAELRAKANAYDVLRENTFTQKVTNELPLKMAMLYFGFDVAAHQNELEAFDSSAGFRRQRLEPRQKAPIIAGEPMAFTDKHKEREKGREAVAETLPRVDEDEAEPSRRKTWRLYGYLGHLEYYTHLPSTACQAIRQLLWTDPKFKTLKFEVIEFGRRNKRLLNRWNGTLPLNPDSRTWTELSNPKDNTVFFIKTAEQPNLKSWVPEDTYFQGSLGRIYWHGDKCFQDGLDIPGTSRLAVRNVSYFPFLTVQPDQDSLKGLYLSHINQHYTNLQRALEVLVGRCFDGTHHCLFGLTETPDMPNEVAVGYGLLTPRPSDILSLHPLYNKQNTPLNPGSRRDLYLVRDPLPNLSLYFMFPGYYPPLSKARSFILTSPEDDHTEAGDKVFRIIQDLLHSCLGAEDMESLDCLALVPHLRGDEEEIVYVDPLRGEALERTGPGFTPPQALGIKLQQWAERMCMIWVVPQWSTQQVMYPGWVHGEELMGRNRYAFPSLGCSLEDFKSQVANMVTEHGNCPEKYDPRTSFISLMGERPSGAKGSNDMDGDAVLHSYSFQITPATTETEWLFIRPQITHRQLEVALRNPSNDDGRSQRADWGQLVADYDPKEHLSLELSEADDAIAGSIPVVAPVDQQRHLRKQDKVAASKRTWTLADYASDRQDSYIKLPSVFGAQGIRLPFHSAPKETLARTSDAAPIDVVEVLTPSQQNQVGMVNQNLRNITLERMMFCPYQGCHFAYPLRDLHRMRSHLEREHTAKCPYCDKSLADMTPTAVGVHLLKNHGNSLRTAGLVLTDSMEVHISEPMVYAPFTQEELRRRFAGEQDSIVSYWLQRGEAQQRILAGKEPRGIPRDDHLLARQYDWDRLQDFLTKASMEEVGMFVQVLAAVAPEESRQSRKQSEPNSSLQEHRGQIEGRAPQENVQQRRPQQTVLQRPQRSRSQPRQDQAESQSRQGQRHNSSARGPPIVEAVTLQGSSNSEEDEPPFEVSLGHPTTYKRNGVVNNRGYRLFLDHYRSRRVAYLAACREQREDPVVLPFGAHLPGSFAPTEEYHLYPKPSAFLAKATIALLGFFRYLCQRKVAFVQNLDHAQAVTELCPEEHVQRVFPAGLTAACIHIVDLYSPIILEKYAELARAIQAEKVGQNAGSSPIPEAREWIRRAENDLVAHEETLRYTFSNAVVMDMTHGQILPETQARLKLRGGGRHIAPLSTGANMGHEAAEESQPPTTKPNQTPLRGKATLEAGLLQAEAEDTSPDEARLFRIEHPVKSTSKPAVSTASKSVQEAGDRHQGATQGAELPITRKPVTDKARLSEPKSQDSLPRDVMDILRGGNDLSATRLAPVAPMEPTRLAPAPQLLRGPAELRSQAHRDSSQGDIDDADAGHDELEISPHLKIPQKAPRQLQPPPRTPPRNRITSPARTTNSQQRRDMQVEVLLPRDEEIEHLRDNEIPTSEISPLSLNHGGRGQPSGDSPESLSDPPSLSPDDQVGHDNDLTHGKGGVGTTDFNAAILQCAEEIDDIDMAGADESAEHLQSNIDALSDASSRVAATSGPSDLPSFLSLSTRRPESPSSDELDAAYYRQSVLRPSDNEGTVPCGPADFVEDTPERYLENCSPPTWRHWKGVQRRGWAGVTLRHSNRVVQIWHGDLYCSRCLRKMPSANDPVNRRRTMEAHMNEDRSCRVPRRIGSIYYLPNQSGFISGDSLRSLKRPITRMRKAFKEQYPQHADTMYPILAKHHNSSVWVSDPNNEDNSDSWELSWPPRRLRHSLEGEGGNSNDSDEDGESSGSLPFSDPGPISRKPRTASGRKRDAGPDASSCPDQDAAESDAEHDSEPEADTQEEQHDKHISKGKRKRQPEDTMIRSGHADSKDNTNVDVESESETLGPRAKKSRKIIFKKHPQGKGLQTTAPPPNSPSSSSSLASEGEEVESDDEIVCQLAPSAMPRNMKSQPGKKQ